MKKYFIIALAALGLCLASCNKDKQEEEKVDLTELNILIERCEALVNNAKLTVYTQQNIATFRQTIEEVKTASADVKKQTVVTSLIARLKDAKAAFEDSAIGGVKNSDTIFKLSFDEGTGTTLKTEGKYEWTATLEKGAVELFKDTKLPEFVEGKIGKALHFADASHLSIKDYVPTAVTGLGAFSISCWVKPDELRASNYIISLNSWHNWKFQTQDGGKPFFTVATDQGITDMDNETDGSVKVGQWSHLAVAFDNTTGNITMYVNGVLTKTWLGTQHDGKHAAGSKLAAIEGENVQIAIGSDETIGMKRGADNAEIKAWDAYFHGAIDELAVYSVALSAGQVLKLYSDGQ